MKTAIFGLGRSGLGALNLLIKHTSHEILVVSDELPASQLAGVRYIKQSSDCAALFAECDQIILSPGIAREHELLELALQNKVPIISEVELAYRYDRTPLIALTGTNGKTTTVTMITQMLEGLGHKVFLGGNIGRPYCEIVTSEEKYDFAVIELSSFQLESIVDFHPKVAVVLNISASHQERYSCLEDYRAAKMRLFVNQTPQDVAIQFPQVPADFQIHSPSLIGEHNQANLYAAYLAVKAVDDRCDYSFVQHFAQSFKGIAYRLQYLGEKKGTHFYNDAKSTNWEATLTALKATCARYSGVCLILGGKLRSEQIEIPTELLESSSMHFLLIGEAASRLVELPQAKNVGDLGGAFKWIEKYAPKAVLFSPAFPSFDQFQDYVERGQSFERLYLDY